jgi:hypothetical protein
LSLGRAEAKSIFHKMANKDKDSDGYGLKLDFDLGEKPETFWQWVEKSPTYPTFRAKNVGFRSFRRKAVAVWPISMLDIGNLDKYVKNVYGDQDVLQKKASKEFSKSWLALSAQGSLGEDEVIAILKESKMESWLKPNRFIPWINAQLLTRTQIEAGVSGLAKLPGFKDIQYLVIPRNLDYGYFFSSSRGGSMPGMSINLNFIQKRMDIAIIDLHKGQLLWDGEIWASNKSMVMSNDDMLEIESSFSNILGSSILSKK